MRPARVLTALAVLASVVVSACHPALTGTSSAEEADPDPAPSRPQARAVPEALDTALRMSTRRAGPATAVLREGQRVPSKPMTYALGPDGSLLQEVGRSDRVGTNGKAVLRPGELSILEGDGRRRTVVRAKQDARPGTQTTFATLEADSVVWIEERSTTVQVSDWTIYAMDRRTRKVVTIERARAVDAAGTKPTVPGFTIPSVEGGKVYWAEAVPNPRAGKPPLTNVYTRPLDGSAPKRLVVRDAVMPTATGGWLYYSRFDGDASGIGGAAQGYAVYRRSLDTGRETPIARDDTGSVTSLSAYGRTVAWILDGRTVQVYRGRTKSAVVNGRERELLSWISVGADTVGFNDGGDVGGNYLLDLRSKRLYDLGRAGGLSKVLLEGRTVLWAMGTERQAWRRATLRD